jgi:hypothetical protein
MDHFEQMRSIQVATWRVLRTKPRARSGPALAASGGCGWTVCLPVLCCGAATRSRRVWKEGRRQGPGPRAQHGTAGCRETPFCCDDVGRNQAFQAGASSAGAGAARRRMTCEPAQSPSPASSSGQHAVPSSRGMPAARSPPPPRPQSSFLGGAFCFHRIAGCDPRTAHRAPVRR